MDLDFQVRNGFLVAATQQPGADQKEPEKNGGEHAADRKGCQQDEPERDFGRAGEQ